MSSKGAAQKHLGLWHRSANGGQVRFSALCNACGCDGHCGHDADRCAFGRQIRLVRGALDDHQVAREAVGHRRRDGLCTHALGRCLIGADGVADEDVDQPRPFVGAQALRNRLRGPTDHAVKRRR